jgi:hypothetical protein
MHAPNPRFPRRLTTSITRIASLLLACCLCQYCSLLIELYPVWAATLEKKIAESTLAALEQGAYQTADNHRVPLAEAQRAAQTGSLLYRPNQADELLRELDQPAGPLAEVRVYQATTFWKQLPNWQSRAAV